MFEIISKIYNGTKLVKYEVLVRNTNNIKIISVETVQGLAMAGSLINATFNEHTEHPDTFQNISYELMDNLCKCYTGMTQSKTLQ